VKIVPSTGAGERILLTGATGFLGGHIVRALLSRLPEATLVLLARGTGEQTAEQRLSALVGRCGEAEDRANARQRIEVLPADIAQERCGLSQEQWEAAARGATRIIHCASSVRFDMALEDARQINVGGARNLLALAEEARRRGDLRSFAYVSTAFVAGRREGLILEDELEKGQRFRNHYERSKCEAEALVQSRAADLPVVVLRPAIIVGDSRTGVTTSFNALYQLFRLYARLRLRIIPARPESVVDIVPVDFVAGACAWLACEPRAAGRTFHLCAGPGRAATIREIVEAAARFFHAPSPRFVPPGPVLALLRPLLLATVWGRSRRFVKRGRIYRPYLDAQLEFDTTQADSLLEPAGIAPPRVMDYLERIFQFCVETDWGRRLPGRVPTS
jgi:long-chain acyl-CoA synthetase